LAKAKSTRGRQLATAGGDVDAAALPHGARKTVLGKYLLKAPGRLAPGGTTLVAGGWVERYQVHLGQLTVEQPADGMGVFRGVIFSLDEGPLVENPPLPAPGLRHGGKPPDEPAAPRPPAG